jgi:hypothetical protein
MKRCDAILLKVFLFGLPLVAAAAAFTYCHSIGVFSSGQRVLEFVSGLAGLVFALWMALALYLSVRLMISEHFRDRVLSKLTFVRERDEREAMLTGQATRNTFMTTLAILIFLFCISCFQISIYRVDPEMAVNGKTGNITLGLGFSLLSSTRNRPPDDAIENIFIYSGLPLSGSALILFMILWQVGYYNYSMRRLSR